MLRKQKLKNLRQLEILDYISLKIILSFILEFILKDNKIRIEMFKFFY